MSGVAIIIQYAPTHSAGDCAMSSTALVRPKVIWNQGGRFFALRCAGRIGFCRPQSGRCGQHAGGAEANA